MKRLLLVLLLIPALGISQKKSEKIPFKYTGTLNSEEDEFTGDVTWTSKLPTYMFLKTQNGKSELYLKIGLRRAVNKPEIQKLLFKVDGKIIEVVRNERDFKTTEVVNTKHTYHDNVKITKQRNSDQIFIDEFVGSYSDYGDLIDLLSVNKSLVRIEEKDNQSDLEITKTEAYRMSKLLLLYNYLKTKENEK